MKKYLFHIFLLLCLPSFLSAQPGIREIDSVNAIPHSYLISNPRKSIALFSTNLEKARRLNYSYGEARALSSLAIASYISGDYDKSTHQCISAIKIFEKEKKYSDLAWLYGEFGYQLKRRDLNKASYYMQLAIKIAQNNHLEKILVGLFDNYGVIKEMQSDMDSAMYFYKKALSMKFSYSDSAGIPYSLNNISGIHAYRKEFKKAFYYLGLSDSYRHKEKGDYGKAENLSLRGNFYSMQGNTDSAIAAYSRCLTLALRTGSKFIIQDSYKQLTNLFRKKHDYKRALDYFYHYTAYNDSILNLETNSRIAELQLDFETEKKDRIIAGNALTMKERTLQLFILSGIVVLLIIISFWIYGTQKAKRERIRKELELKNLLSKSEMENRMRSEKLRISRELHDNIGSHLTFMISSLDNLSYTLKGSQALEKINGVRNFGRDTLMELRNTVWAIKHEEGDTDHLILKIHELVLRLNNENAAACLTLRNNLTRSTGLSSTQMLNIYRIVQEALQNAIKYACAGEISVIFSDHAEGFKMEIRDNGKGFDPKSVKCGNGLNNMKQRCSEASGEFIIESSEKGTVITCLFS